jgi:hypothetical protein
MCPAVLEVQMKVLAGTKISALVLLALALAVGRPVSAQITTGTVAGTIKDTQGGVIPGATVVLISESRGTKSIPVVTNETGDWVMPNVTADTYTVEVTMSGFKTLTRKGVLVSGGDRVVVGTLTLQVGGTTETVDVTAEAPMIQAQSGERSFTVTTTQVENLPVDRSNFANLARMAPGVFPGSQSGQAASRLGASGQNNLQMDGISAMDTGNNGQMLNLNIESIAEVKILTQGYQAEYGRSSGLQITAVSKSGTNRFHGSLYDVERNSDWDTINWQDKANGNPKPELKDRHWGYSIGGPVGKPGGNNKLFFFYSHEFHPQTTSGTINRFRVPTAAERVGDFSQSLDNNGKPIPQLFSPYDRSPYPNNVIPASDLYSVGLNLLNRYPLPSETQAPGTNYNLEIARPQDNHLIQQPAVRVDYQLSPALRITGHYSAQRDQQRVVQGTMPGFNDVLVPYPYITNYSFTVDYTLNPTTFIEATYGTIKNELAGGGSGGILVNDSANRLNGLADLPLLYPNAGKVDPRYYQLDALTRTGALYFDGTSVNLPPNFNWNSSLLASQPPNQQYPGWLNVNKTQDFTVSITKVAGHHTMKAGFYNNHSFKAQNTGAGGVANLSFQGYINFANDTQNAIDVGFPFANAATGVFDEYLQASQLIEGNMIYNNTEFYLQDNWKMTPRLTLDYGMRFTHQQPQYDQFGQMSNFFPDQWSASAAPTLYVPACASGVYPCAASDRNAMNPLTGEILTVPGAKNSSAFIGTVVPDSGDRLNGIRAAGDGIAKTGYTWPAMVFGPRFGAAYDISGDQRMVIRGGLGLFYDRPDGNTVFSIPGNPPFADSQDVRYGNLQNLGNSVSTVGVPALITFQYDADVPSSVQWNGGVQMALPWNSSLDLSYVGSHGYNMMGGFQGGNTLNLNAIDIGAAYLPENQDPTLAPSTVPGADVVTTNLLRPLVGLSSIGQNTTGFYETSHSIQASFNRRFVNGLSFGVNYTLGLSYTGNTGLPNPERLTHAADGTISVSSDNQAWYDLMQDLDNRRHTIVANAVWDMPDLSADGGAKRVAAAILNDWQLSGVLTAGSANHYDLSYSYQSNGSNVNLTGSPDYGARIVFNGDPGSGCSDNQYAQFNASAVAGPTYFSNGMESGRNILEGCPNKTVDLALVRNFRLGGGRQAQVRVDAFNAFNVLVFNGRQTQLQLTNPVDQTVRNSQFLSDGSVDPTKTQPKNAGFGGATSAQAMRTVQLTFRLSF